jgi:actin related protein 2/3 complex, subunit 1A/1B
VCHSLARFFSICQIFFKLLPIFFFLFARIFFARKKFSQEKIQKGKKKTFFFANKMAAPNISQLAQVITCHAFNGDCSMVAICPNNNEIRVFVRGSDGKFDRESPKWILSEHDQVVTGIDWAPQSNRLVSCSQDRNAYVWEFVADRDDWKPTLVILRINRAATQVKWSPNEDKFAVASGAKSVSVCYFEEDNDWWVSKHIRKQITSTILSIAWHPNNILLACGGTDWTARVVSGFVKGIDKRPGQTVFGVRLPFGENLAEWGCEGWVHAIRWSPSGNQLAWVSHDSYVTVCDASQGHENAAFYYVRMKGLPFNDLVFTSETQIVAAGHSCNPTIFDFDGTAWKQSRELDAAEVKKATTTGTRAAFSMFQNRVNTGQEEKVATLNTKHQNAITCITVVDGKHVATTGLDGKLVVWQY